VSWGTPTHAETDETGTFAFRFPRRRRPVVFGGLRPNERLKMTPASPAVASGLDRPAVAIAEPTAPHPRKAAEQRGRPDPGRPVRRPHVGLRLGTRRGVLAAVPTEVPVGRTGLEPVTNGS
jgi:hypothetical protein